jgi:hypothetical protein
MTPLGVALNEAGIQRQMRSHGAYSGAASELEMAD